MEITNIKFRNFRSYGNTFTEFEFPKEGGELISIYGVSGSGKSSISDLLDWVFYKKVRGKKRTWATLSSLYNRFNGGTEAEIKFHIDKTTYNLSRTTDNVTIGMDNGVAPQGGKASHENYLSSILELDIDTFKNFVSVDISDFRNFSSMKTADKRDLMDRLFSLEMLTNIGDIASQLGNKTHGKSNEHFRTSEVLLQNSIKQKESSLLLEEEKKSEIEAEMKSLKKEGKFHIESKKTLENNLIELGEKSKSLDSEIHNLWMKCASIKSNIDNTKNVLTNIGNDTCPFCLSEIGESHRTHIVPIQKKIGKGLVNELNEYEEKISILKDEKYVIDTEISNRRGNINEMEMTIRKIMDKYSTLQKEIDSDLVTESYWMDLEKQSLDHKMKSIQFEEDSKQWTILKSIFSENGLKKDIMENICHPINEKMNIYAGRLDFPYGIKMDSSFDMHFYEGANEIDIDTLSNGEESRANMALLLSWLSIIHSRVKVNILFLDEIFKPLDPYTTELCIKFIKEWAVENHINVITTHHSELPMYFFDKVYKVTKNIFSSVERVK